MLRHRAGRIAYLLLLLPVFVTASVMASPAGQTGIPGRAATMFALLERYHIRTPADARTIVKPDLVKREFLAAVDSSGFFLMKDDVDRLMSIPLRVDGLLSGDVVFFDAAVITLRERLLQMQADPLLDNEKINEWPAWVEFHSGSDPSYTKTPTERRERWKKLLRHRMLLQAFFEKPDATVAEFQALLDKNGESYLAIARKRELARIQRKLEHPDGFEKSLSSLFLNIISSQYDPHTAFFSMSDRKMMEESLSARAMTYGFTISRSTGGEIRIERLIPGGAADRSGKLRKQDVLLLAELQEPAGVRQVHFADLSLDEADEQLSHPRSMQMTLTVRRADGSTERVSLRKQKARSERNAVNGFLLKGSSRVGYIYLPSFYANWDSPDAPAFADDVAREILKLKRDGMQGLILDLRGNGGGSVQEALNLAGLFIDSGPFMVERQREGRPRLLKDPSRGTVYDGPLILLVNGQSASASEFFAQILRDYDRALIVGNTTFGKATSQVVLPLTLDDRILNRPQLWSQLNIDSLKLTVNVYYNLEGTSHQRRGVEPDIVLPEPVAPAENSGEAGYPSALEGDSIDRKISIEKSGELPRSKLLRKSRNRMSDGRFGRMTQIAERLAPAFAPVERFSLEPQAFFEKMQGQWKDFEAMDAVLFEKSSEYTVVVDRAELDIEKMDPYRKEMNDFQRERIERDLYIEESYRIMDDWL